MNYRSTTKTGVGVGGVGIAVTLLTTTLLIFVPQYLLSPAASDAYISAWSGHIMSVGGVVMGYGLPLLSALSAWSLLSRGHSARSVLRGFVVGGLVLGVGVALSTVAITHVLVSDPAIGKSVVGHVADTLELGGRLVGGALVGILCAYLVGRVV